MNSPRPRIQPGSLGEAGPFSYLLAHAAGRVTGTNPPNLFLTLGRHPRLFRSWLWFAATLMPGGRLPRHESEMVILRVAHLRGCEYEWEHHRRIGRRAGVGPTILDRIVAGPAAPGWTPRHQAMLSAVDALHENGDLDDVSWDRLRGHLAEPECVELCMLAGHYHMLATLITALRIQPDRPLSRR